MDGQAAKDEVANIGPRERAKRRVMGIVALTAGVAFAFVLVVFGAPRVLRLVVFFPVWLAGLGLLQSRERTCIALAARGVCNMDDGERPVGDEAAARELRARARRINRRALVTAAAAALVAFVFPS